MIELAEVSSTNDWIAERAASLADESWVRADRQTAGRGRRGRVWVSESGNLYASVLCRPQTGEGPAQQLSFVAALAAFMTLAIWVPGERLRIKWPNDILLDGKKCAGILLESSPAGTVIGFGMNLAHAPQVSERPATSLAESDCYILSPQDFARGRLPTPQDAQQFLGDGFAGWRTAWRRRGFAPVRQQWLDWAHGQGTQLEARLGRETIVGRFEDLGPDGALVLRLDDGSTRAIHAGEVFGL